MIQYHPPLKTMIDSLFHGISGLPQSYQNRDLDAQTITAILEEAAKLARDVLSPLNKIGDQQGCIRTPDGGVKTAAGFKEAYHHYQSGGWNSLPFDPTYGGQGLPWSLAFAIQEMWQSANMAFGLCPLLNQGAVEALTHHGSPALKDFYLPKLISGEWTGTMNLTEPQAGSDLSLLQTKAIPANESDIAGDRYHIFGQKIYITYGAHDFVDRIIHLVLARLPDSVVGSNQISLFLVPSHLPDGSINDVTCTGLEHKIGIHASPTCTMQFGDKGGAIGWLIGEAHQGLKCMFTMMNNARLSVGLQGVAQMERARQAAIQYAEQRKQGKSIDAKDGESVSITQHGDIQRMLMHLNSITQAARLMTYHAAHHIDQNEKDHVAFLTPVVKSWCTDQAVEMTSLCIQIHGGMGYIEETGVAQFWRDARILPIYEGTNGIQAADFMGRKILKDQGHFAVNFLQQQIDYPHKQSVIDMIKTLSQTRNPHAINAASAPFLNAVGWLLGGIFLKQYAANLKENPDIQASSTFYEKVLSPHIAHELHQVGGLLDYYQ